MENSESASLKISVDNPDQTMMPAEDKADLEKAYAELAKKLLPEMLDFVKTDNEADTDSDSMDTKSDFEQRSDDELSDTEQSDAEKNLDGAKAITGVNIDVVVGDGVVNVVKPIPKQLEMTTMVYRVPPPPGMENVIPEPRENLCKDETSIERELYNYRHVFPPSTINWKNTSNVQKALTDPVWSPNYGCKFGNATKQLGSAENAEKDDFTARLEQHCRHPNNPYVMEVNRAIFGSTIGHPKEGSRDYYKAAEKYAIYGTSFLDFPNNTLPPPNGVQKGITNVPKLAIMQEPPPIQKSHVTNVAPAQLPQPQPVLALPPPPPALPALAALTAPQALPALAAPAALPALAAPQALAAPPAATIPPASQPVPSVPPTMPPLAINVGTNAAIFPRCANAPQTAQQAAMNFTNNYNNNYNYNYNMNNTNIYNGGIGMNNTNNYNGGIGYANNIQNNTFQVNQVNQANLTDMNINLANYGQICNSATNTCYIHTQTHTHTHTCNGFNGTGAGIRLTGSNAQQSYGMFLGNKMTYLAAPQTANTLIYNQHSSTSTNFMSNSLANGAVISPTGVLYSNPMLNSTQQYLNSYFKETQVMSNNSTGIYDRLCLPPSLQQQQSYYQNVAAVAAMLNNSQTHLVRQSTTAATACGGGNQLSSFVSQTASTLQCGRQTMQSGAASAAEMYIRTPPPPPPPPPGMAPRLSSPHASVGIDLNTAHLGGLE